MHETLTKVSKSRTASVDYRRTGEANHSTNDPNVVQESKLKEHSNSYVAGAPVRQIESIRSDVTHWCCRLPLDDDIPSLFYLQLPILAGGLVTLLGGRQGHRSVGISVGNSPSWYKMNIILLLSQGRTSGSSTNSTVFFLCQVQYSCCLTLVKAGVEKWPEYNEEL